MAEIKIPFKDRFFVPIQIGQKTMTTRSRRYGEVGDIFRVGNTVCVITDIKKMKLYIVQRDLYKQEGFESPEEFKEFWLKIHRDWQPERFYWVHEFERIP